jgi:hypothetical protein
LIKSADYGEITTKRLPLKSKNNYKAVFKHGPTGNEWKIDICNYWERRSTNTKRLRLERQLLPILMKGVNDVKGFSRLRQITASKPPPKRQMRTLQRLL